MASEGFGDNLVLLSWYKYKLLSMALGSAVESSLIKWKQMLLYRNQNV